MRQLIVTAVIVITGFSCGLADKKVKEAETKDTTAATLPDTTRQQPVIDQPVVTDPVKTVKLTFSGYDEGDYSHLMFKETGTGTDYDFGHPDGNNLNNIAVVIKDDNSSFGYKENSKMIGAKFIAGIIYKMVDTHDEDGQPKKAKEWRITSLNKDE